MAHSGIKGVGNTILPYRILEPRLAYWRAKGTGFRRSTFLSLTLFIAALILGSLLSSLIARPAYFILLRPTLTGIDFVAALSQGSAYALATAIFAKNLVAVLVTVGLARRTRGISILAILLINGLIIGSIMTSLIHGGNSWFTVLAGVVPHGVPELTAILIGCGAGLSLLLAEDRNLVARRATTARVLVLGVIPLLAVAAFIEAFITPTFIQ